MKDAVDVLNQRIAELEADNELLSVTNEAHRDQLDTADHRIAELEAKNKELRGLLKDITDRVMPLHPICLAASQLDAMREG